MSSAPIVIDGKGHLLGRLASIVAKQAISGQKVVVVCCIGRPSRPETLADIRAVSGASLDRSSTSAPLQDYRALPGIPPTLRLARPGFQTHHPLPRPDLRPCRPKVPPKNCSLDCASSPLNPVKHTPPSSTRLWSAASRPTISHSSNASSSTTSSVLPSLANFYAIHLHPHLIPFAKSMYQTLFIDDNPLKNQLKTRLLRPVKALHSIYVKPQIKAIPPPVDDHHHPASAIPSSSSSSETTNDDQEIPAPLDWLGLLVIVTHSDKLVILTKTFDVLCESQIEYGRFGDDQLISLGWGTKATQFHGSLGKSAARSTHRPLIPFHLPLLLPY
ncbi:hypothetical protein PGTUg99_002583 [Puccinia graminis f. sp. tritici]|uniref:ELP1 first N-terminal beta-propeller domain-containing protein n=1 Tax=Puccinia graminis f. sp. tritici TaxID=56615 RepID=A0A5B0S244_PUCGR|nr:hypothetical protein PGTUg99_002583 [Puccinia graminis f. sp. tritici]